MAEKQYKYEEAFDTARNLKDKVIVELRDATDTKTKSDSRIHWNKASDIGYDTDNYSVQVEGISGQSPNQLTFMILATIRVAEDNQRILLSLIITKHCS